MMVLITGGTGYVAGWCVAELLKRGFRVRATIRSKSKEDIVRQAVATETDPGNRLSFVLADLKGMPGTPRIGFEVVDVRDLVDIHIRAMTAPEAAGQRFLATGEFMWMSEAANALRDGVGDAAGKVPTRNLPDFVVRVSGVFDRSLREIMPALGRRHRHSTAKAKELLGWQARPAAETVVACAKSLIEHNAV
ncbi:nucleoside-diphosphate-sugar epimerase [Kibdelosporangium banguiense]|uniref:Nucleoside-diphosphate-sugar epimerase n=1 Tax=Kibdelosporangium banguiense TaxID=1365924 RepID=A0ABS4TZ32_9PSEU|nr:NmrA family NAD(P)-binding protein [Kibdelosporangium banguiense]MBP2329672.1 nucleoside-diphosphate-sugar epimerase [Kibdelosporangium banguiense]